ncbi:nicotinate-nucleotide adenylyltransferase [Methylocapsa sp. D3K7]|uniref:nicotinate-nucleotide adenylyltransferase n=1 Tax=Methylocapsa sp. D3K7 TaxID=3041435 RepID=UPI00244EC537|nr:nicotinate-nucleotide adenylyltransferase [Methylocapsa sp. D3K7]WGJ13910.1 nicotinate-nucleotide adenylyltransferase [Methylocapsa sp. D3K7]
MNCAPYVKIPPFVPGLRVGLFGGSFNPPHDGHRSASLLALRRLRLDRIWWLVSPANPLKDKSELAPLAERAEAAVKISRHPRIVVSVLEARIGAAYSYQTITYLKRRCSGVHFVWIMGADNFRSFDRWQHWREIARLVPIAIVDRPGSTLTAPSGRAAETLAAYRVDEADAGCLVTEVPPAFVFLHGPRSPMSSTALRETSQRIIARPKTA